MSYTRISRLLLLAFLALTPLRLEAQRAKPVPTKSKEQLEKEMWRQYQRDLLVCRKTSPSNIPKPQIAVTEIKPASTLSRGRYKVKGIISGVCLKEAGLYHNGERVLEFPLKTSRLYKYFPFELEVKEENKPEIRAFTVNWMRASLMLVPEKKKD